MLIQDGFKWSQSIYGNGFTIWLNFTFSRPSRRAAPLEFIFDTNTPSSAASIGLPR